ncbi:MAG: dihydroorotase [Flavobacteriales bacterium]|nr:MAG: dihydroorotase [Flavobacteriales bacterium]
MNILIKQAVVVDKNSKYHLSKRDVLIEKGRISKIAGRIANDNKVKEIKLDNLHVSAGWVDSAACYGEPGFEDRENIQNGLDTALKSGFTDVLLCPNTNPVIDNKSAVQFVVNKASEHLVNLYPIGALSKGSEGKDLAELYDMQQSGAVAFYDYKKAVKNPNIIKLALLYAQHFNGLVCSFPQDRDLVNNGQANEGNMSTRLGLKGNPAMAETLQIARDLFILEYTGGKLHIPTITTAESVELIAKAKKKGLQVTCGVTPHHLFLSDDVLSDFNTNYKVNPPLRTKKDIAALKKGVKNGTIDIICSDHNPVDIEHKKVTFENAMPGTIGQESLFGAVNSLLSIEQAIPCLTDNPRKIFGLPIVKITEGENACLTLFNPDVSYTFHENHIYSLSKNAAFIGKQLKGKVYGIFANNKLQMN